MISLIAIFTILACHWVFDFVCQTHWQATNKSVNNTALLEHTAIYSGAWVVPGLIGMWLGGVDSYIHILQFIGLTMIFHTITDYLTSRLNSSLWKKGDVHNFFVSVGFDQLLHYVQLILTYKLLMG